MLIPKNFEGYKSLVRFTNGRKIEQSSWENIIKIFLSGENQETPWGEQAYYLANSESEDGVYIRENLFLKEEDYEAFALVTAIKNESLYESELELNSHLRSNFLLQKDFLANARPNWLKNLLKILKSCEFYPTSEINILATEKPPQEKERTEIIKFCRSRLTKYLKDIEEKEPYSERLKLEIKLFDLKEYWNYLFIFFKLLQHIKEKEILTSAGRGSASSSLIIFLLGISKVDPLKYGLLLDRFLNISSERVPDLDLDIESLKKQELLDYLGQYFGRDNFVIPLVQKKIKNINLINSALTRSMPNFLESSNKKLLNKLINLPFLYQPHVSSLIPIDLENPPLLHISEEYELSFPVVFLEYNLSSYFSLQKFDLLSSPYLDFIAEILRKIKETRKIDLKFSELDLKDSNTYKLIGSGATYSLFHLDNEMIQKVLKQFEPQSISDLAQLISVIRPGINRHISKFLNYDSGRQQFSNPRLNDILSETRGIILYQEQIMSIISLVLDIPLYLTDKYRVALQKKDLTKLVELEKEFLNIISGTGLPRKEQTRIWEFIKSFGEYSFNKAHAVGYALSAYQAAYLKANFSEEFFLTLLEKEGITEQILKELVKMGFQLELPELLSQGAYWGSFPQGQKLFQIGLNILKNTNYEFFEKVQKSASKIIEQEELRDLREIISFLFEEGFSKSELLILNYLNWFRKIFKPEESQKYFYYNLNTFYDEWLFGSSQDPSSLKTDFTLKEVELFLESQLDSLKIDLRVFNLLT